MYTLSISYLWVLAEGQIKEEQQNEMVLICQAVRQVLSLQKTLIRCNMMFSLLTALVRQTWGKKSTLCQQAKLRIILFDSNATHRVWKGCFVTWSVINSLLLCAHNIWGIQAQTPYFIFKLNWRAVYTGALASEQQRKANTLQKGVWRPKEIFQVPGKTGPPDCWGGNDQILTTSS